MRFLIDVHHIGGRQTGNETIARNISRELAALSMDDDLRFAAAKTGITQVTELTGRSPERLSDSAVRRVAIELPRLARRLDASALLVQYTKPLTRRPCAVMIHDLSPFDPQSVEWLPIRFRIRVRASIDHSARSAATLIACSEFTRAGLIARYDLDPARVYVAHSAVDPRLAELLDAAPPTEPRSSGQRVIAVGNVLPRKNLVTLGAAISRLRTAGLAVELRVVGSVPPTGTAIQDQLRQLLGDAVSFTGYVSDVELAAEYAAADLLAFPSLFEGFGIPAVEAMYAGVPVVVSDAGSLPEVVGDAGTVVPASDVAAWAAALGALLEESELRRAAVERGRVQSRSMTWPGSAAVVHEALRHAARDSREPS
jgi:glycosyltransferase involved in cell wall biosynthesis